MTGLQPIMLPQASIPAAIESMRRNADRAKAFTKAFADMMGAAVGPPVSVFERDEKVKHLAHTMELWLVGDTEEQISALESRSYQSFATPETLMELVKQRDRLADQIGALESQLPTLDEITKKAPEMSGLRGMMEAQIMPLRNQLEDLEEQISAVQRQLESTSAANSGATTEVQP